MYHVILAGWRPGLQKVALTKLLMAEGGLALGEAKEQVDRCLAGAPARIALPSLEAAQLLARHAEELGANAAVEQTVEQLA